MSPLARNLALTAHVSFSVGWFGAVAAFLGLSILGLTSQHEETVRGVYLVMEPAAWFVLVPLAFGSLVSGLVQGLVTPWGLARHYWVVAKLLINVFATTILLVYMRTFSALADVAAHDQTELRTVRNVSPAFHAALALVLLLAATVLAVYKPRGLTPYGQRRSQTRLARTVRR